MTDWVGISMETVVEEHERTEVFPATDSGIIRLSPHGLWDGTGVYTSPVVDIGTVVTLSGVFWDSVESFGTSIDSRSGLPKTLELRYHDYAAPTINDTGYPWSDGQIPSDSDPFWGTSGLEWVEWENDFRNTGVDIRYVQWRATLRTVRPAEETAVVTQSGEFLITEDVNDIDALVVE
jgi:hypothetical protein